jgi:hypothetical protein
MATLMTTTAALILKELKSIIELSSGGRPRAGDNDSRHYQRRGSPLEAITCVVISSCNGAKDFLKTMPSTEESFRDRSPRASSFAK